MTVSTESRSETVPQRLQQRLDALIRRIEGAEFLVAITDPQVDPRLVTAALKYVYLSISQYQPHVTEATFTAVGRMPKDSEQLIRTMICQQVEEVEHAEMALRDYRRLGGDEALTVQYGGPYAMWPECAAVAAVCRYLGEHTHPACYLGFMYIFEALTPVMAARVQQIMSAKDYAPDAREFIDLHATEDIRHTNVILKVMDDLVATDATAGSAIEHGYDCFAQVYPIPVWDAALRHARAELESNGTRHD